MSDDALRAGRKDAAAGGVLLILAGLYFWQTRQIQQSSLSDEVGPEGLPLLLASALAIVALAIGARGLWIVLRERTVAPVPAKVTAAENEVATVLRALGLVAIGVGYMVVTPIVGYAVGIALLVAAVSLYEGLRPNLQLAGVAIGAGLLFWLFFVLLLGTDQPAGRLF